MVFHATERDTITQRQTGEKEEYFNVNRTAQDSHGSLSTRYHGVGISLFPFFLKIMLNFTFKLTLGVTSFRELFLNTMERKNKEDSTGWDSRS